MPVWVPVRNGLFNISCSFWSAEAVGGVGFRHYNGQVCILIFEGPLALHWILLTAQMDTSLSHVSEETTWGLWLSTWNGGGVLPEGRALSALPASFPSPSSSPPSPGPRPHPSPSVPLLPLFYFIFTLSTFKFSVLRNGVSFSLGCAGTAWNGSRMNSKVLWSFLMTHLFGSLRKLLSHNAKRTKMRFFKS